MQKKPIRIAITSGDLDGIGSEIVAKALVRMKIPRNVRLYLWRSTSFSKKYLQLIDSKFKRITVATWPEALKTSAKGSREIIDICSHLAPAKWVEQSAQASLFGHLEAIATAPLSKSGMFADGYKLSLIHI